MLALNTRMHSYTKIAYLFHSNESYDMKPEKNTERFSLRMTAITATSKSTALTSTSFSASRGGLIISVMENSLASPQHYLIRPSRRSLNPKLLNEPSFSSLFRRSYSSLRSPEQFPTFSPKLRWLLLFFTVSIVRTTTSSK
ncbi:hypothetical protein CTAM01_07747 [Colletotrichum tamarilloi]|uniref:Uncharacterized protein n=1 Tax=Colletotrichum tamarilloi TaxID=1209934 RepID=A0ABQ9R8E2_9PEZI|nr:uncharacterized protein CTAM01_07747 [Colletotrichum tamarilloi]KAK1497477.1 hypothetical protein CTAM01_07747 [Colletotrichum tamarilloi]